MTMLSLDSPRMEPNADPNLVDSVVPNVVPALVVGRFDADRLCRKCVHQLSGQQVYRDARLDLLYVRCPECGTNTAVTEFPVSGRWMRRLGAFVIAVMLCAGLLLLAADVGASSGLTYLAPAESTGVYVGALQEAGARVATSSAGSQPGGNWYAPPALIPDSVTLQRIGTDGKLQRMLWMSFGLNVVPAAIASAISGVLWAIVLLHRRASRAWIWLLVPQTLAAGFALLAFWLPQTYVWAPNTDRFLSYSDLALFNYGFVPLVVAIGITAVIRIAAFFIARPLVKGMSAIILPSKLRQIVADEWKDPVPPVVG